MLEALYLRCDSLPMQLVMEVLKHLEGAYALLFKSSLYPGEMVACKRGSPLILGIREAPDGSTVRLASVHDESLSHAAESLECFIASDASAVVEHTKKCVLLHPSLASVAVCDHKEPPCFKDAAACPGCC
jgi:glucosamine--fructose-6-phosphate aminotransferase (isomerizing)